MANTADRQLWLVNADDDTLETYTYSANNSSGISDEKIVMGKDDSTSNWENSFQTNGTPGERNSVTPLGNDLSFHSITINPAIPIMGDDVQVTGLIKNNGTNTAQTFSIEIYNDINLDSSGSQQELIFSQTFSNLLPGDSMTINTSINSANEGSYQLIGKINFPEDEDTTNNRKIIQFKVNPPGNNYNDVVINEIMYAPSSGEPEWVELYNTTNESINIGRWRFADPSSGIIISDQILGEILGPHEFIILSSHESITQYYNVPSKVLVVNLPTLNNSGDILTLTDLDNGKLIDSVAYLPAWGGTGGHSLERVSAEGSSTLLSNWGTSVSKNKATPGNINSITPKDFDLKISSFISGNSYGIIGVEINFTIKVANPGLNASGNFHRKNF